MWSGHSDVSHISPLAEFILRHDCSLDSAAGAELTFCSDIGWGQGGENTVCYWLMLDVMFQFSVCHLVVSSVYCHIHQRSQSLRVALIWLQLVSLVSTKAAGQLRLACSYQLMLLFSIHQSSFFFILHLFIMLNYCVCTASQTSLCPHIMFSVSLTR